MGAVLLYFLNIALLKAPILDLTWSIHAGIRFLIGFFILGVSCFYAHVLKFKHALYIIAGIVAADYVYDYYTQTYRFKFEIMFHGVFMVAWGSILGYLTAKYMKDRSMR